LFLEASADEPHNLDAHDLDVTSQIAVEYNILISFAKSSNTFINVTNEFQTSARFSFCTT
jgi:hypothetical protein